MSATNTTVDWDCYFITKATEIISQLVQQLSVPYCLFIIYVCLFVIYVCFFVHNLCLFYLFLIDVCLSYLSSIISFPGLVHCGLKRAKPYSLDHCFKTWRRKNNFNKPIHKFPPNHRCFDSNLTTCKKTHGLGQTWSGADACVRPLQPPRFAKTSQLKEI